jgi:hypothetical protein
VGTGGNVGSDGVLVGSGVGGAEMEGAGRVAGDVDCAGGADGAALGGGGGVAVGAVDTAGGVPAGPGRISRGGAAVVDVSLGDLVAGATVCRGASCPAASRLRLKPASATPTAREGARSTYRVKEARPLWPKARPSSFPSRPPIAW